MAEQAVEDGPPGLLDHEEQRPAPQPVAQPVAQPAQLSVPPQLVLGLDGLVEAAAGGVEYNEAPTLGNGELKVVPIGITAPDGSPILAARLGGGCFGNVYLVRCQGKLCAAKIAHPDAPAGEMRHEVDVLLRCAGCFPELVAVVEDENGPCAVITALMNLAGLDGEARKVGQDGRFELFGVPLFNVIGQTLTLFRQLSARGYAHRDVKSDNILVARVTDGKSEVLGVSLADPGLCQPYNAKLREVEAWERNGGQAAVRQGISRHDYYGNAVAQVAEVHLHQQLQPNSDLPGLGMMLVELVLGLNDTLYRYPKPTHLLGEGLLITLGLGTLGMPAGAVARGFSQLCKNEMVMLHLLLIALGLMMVADPAKRLSMEHASELCISALEVLIFCKKPLVNEVAKCHACLQALCTLAEPEIASRMPMALRLRCAEVYKGLLNGHLATVQVLSVQGNIADQIERVHPVMLTSPMREPMPHEAFTAAMVDAPTLQSGPEYAIYTHAGNLTDALPLLKTLLPMLGLWGSGVGEPSAMFEKALTSTGAAAQNGFGLEENPVLAFRADMLRQAAQRRGRGPGQGGDTAAAEQHAELLLQVEASRRQGGEERPNAPPISAVGLALNEVVRESLPFIFGQLFHSQAVSEAAAVGGNFVLLAVLPVLRQVTVHGPDELASVQIQLAAVKALCDAASALLATLCDLRNGRFDEGWLVKGLSTVASVYVLRQQLLATLETASQWRSSNLPSPQQRLASVAWMRQASTDGISHLLWVGGQSGWSGDMVIHEAVSVALRCAEAAYGAQFVAQATGVALPLGGAALLAGGHGQALPGTGPPPQPAATQAQGAAAQLTAVPEHAAPTLQGAQPAVATEQPAPDAAGPPATAASARQNEAALDDIIMHFEQDMLLQDPAPQAAQAQGPCGSVDRLLAALSSLPCQGGSIEFLREALVQQPAGGSEAERLLTALEVTVRSCAGVAAFNAHYTSTLLASPAAMASATAAAAAGRPTSQPSGQGAALPMPAAQLHGPSGGTPAPSQLHKPAGGNPRFVQQMVRLSTNGAFGSGGSLGTASGSSAGSAGAAATAARTGPMNALTQMLARMGIRGPLMPGCKVHPERHAGSKRPHGEAEEPAAAASPLPAPKARKAGFMPKWGIRQPAAPAQEQEPPAAQGAPAGTPVRQDTPGAGGSRPRPSRAAAAAGRRQALQSVTVASQQQTPARGLKSSDDVSNTIRALAQRSARPPFKCLVRFVKFKGTRHGKQQQMVPRILCLGVDGLGDLRIGQAEFQNQLVDVHALLHSTLLEMLYNGPQSGVLLPQLAQSQAVSEQQLRGFLDHIRTEVLEVSLDCVAPGAAARALPSVVTRLPFDGEDMDEQDAVAAAKDGAAAGSSKTKSRAGTAARYASCAELAALPAKERSEASEALLTWLVGLPGGKVPLLTDGGEVAVRFRLDKEHRFCPQASGAWFTLTCTLPTQQAD